MPVGVGSIMYYSGLGLFLVFWNWNKITPRFHAVLLTAFFGITACFIWIQLANPGWLIINASYTVVYIWCDITVEDQRRRELYTEISRKNEELKIVAKKAEAAAEAKSEFLSRMSHDIRTPMNAIIGLTHLAKQENDLQVIKEYLQKIDSSSQFLLGLINDILDLSKIENGEMTLNESPFTREEFRDSIQTVIERFQCIVDVATNGQEAVDQFARSPEHFYDVILMDVHMPVMNGIEATKAIRALDRRDATGVPIIAMTADAFDTEKQQTLEAGMNSHLPKPINPQDIYRMLSQYRNK